MADTVKTTFVLETHNWLKCKIYAVTTGKTMSDVVNQALEKYLENIKVGL